MNRLFFFFIEFLCEKYFENFHRKFQSQFRIYRIFTFEKKEGIGYTIIDAKLYAMKNPLLSTNDMLYRFCTPNVYQEHGRIFSEKYE